MSGGGFLARWSRRKRGEDGPEPRDAGTPDAGTRDARPEDAGPQGAEVRAPGFGGADGPAVVPARVPAPPADAPAPTGPGVTHAGDPHAADAPRTAGAPLPSLEDLARGGDLGPFLRPDVPRALRRAALRRAWTLDPAIRDFVGPADYAWDFNAPDAMPGFALDLGGNLEELLAQAIGAPAAPPPARGDAPADVAAHGVPAPGVAATDPPPEPPVVPQPRLVAATAPGDPTPAVPAPPPPAPPPRRHGGAVPA